MSRTGVIELTEGGTIPSGKTISGSGTIAVNSSGTAAGLSGTPDITVGTVNGSTGIFQWKCFNWWNINLSGCH